MSIGKVFDTTTVGFGLIALILFILIWLKDPSAATESAKGGLALFVRYSFLIIFSMMVAAMLPALVSKEVIARYLGGASGWRGVLLGTLIGGLMPGAPYAVFPFIAGLMKLGMGIAPAVSMVCAWGLWSIGRVPFEAAIMGTRFTLVQVMVSLPLPIIAGTLAGTLARILQFRF